jgi:hypothetical protein
LQLPVSLRPCTARPLACPIFEVRRTRSSNAGDHAPSLLDSIVANPMNTMCPAVSAVKMSARLVEHLQGLMIVFPARSSEARGRRKLVQDTWADVARGISAFAGRHCRLLVPTAVLLAPRGRSRRARRAMHPQRRRRAGPGDVTALPSGHDAWVVGDEPAVVVDWCGASDYGKRT